MDSQVELISKGYHCFVPGLISIFRDGMGPFKEWCNFSDAGQTQCRDDEMTQFGSLSERTMTCISNYIGHILFYVH